MRPMISTQALEPLPPVIEVMDSTGRHRMPAIQDAVGYLRTITFAWLDLENPNEEQLRHLGESLELEPGTAATLKDTGQRPSFTVTSNSVRARLPVADASGPLHPRSTVWVSAVLTSGCLLTVHAAPCPPLQGVRARYGILQESAKTDGALAFFLVLDTLVGSLEPQLLALHERLDEIQEILIEGSPVEIHDEVINIRRTLTEFDQGLSWYSGDLEDLAEALPELPGMRPGTGTRFDRHQLRVARMREAVKDYREEAKDALAQEASNADSRQGQLINMLTVYATLFLPLTFITGYFGMNFGVIANHLQSNLAFVLLGLLLPAASVTFTYVRYRRLTKRLGVGAPAVIQKTRQSSAVGVVVAGSRGAAGRPEMS